MNQVNVLCSHTQISPLTVGSVSDGKCMSISLLVSAEPLQHILLIPAARVYMLTRFGGACQTETRPTTALAS